MVKRERVTGMASGKAKGRELCSWPRVSGQPGSFNEEEEEEEGEGLLLSREWGVTGDHVHCTCLT